MATIQEMGIKDLENVTIRATSDIQNFGGVDLEAGEPILYFDHIQISQLSEQNRVVAARGGFHNEPRVIWENRGNLEFEFSNGTLNQRSFALLLGAKFLQQNKTPPIHAIEQHELYGDSITLLHTPYQDEKHKIFLFVYRFQNIQQKIPRDKYTINNGHIKISDSSLKEELQGEEINIDYYYSPDKNSDGTDKIPTLSYTLSRERLSNVYSLEATFNLKDENTGEEHSGIIEMPKVSIASNINLRMGERTNPMVGQFTVIAMPENKDDIEELICKITFFDEDLTAI